MRVVIRIAACVQDGASGRDIAVDLNIPFDTRARTAPAFADQSLEVGKELLHQHRAGEGALCGIGEKFRRRECRAVITQLQGGSANLQHDLSGRSAKRQWCWARSYSITAPSLNKVREISAESAGVFGCSLR